MRATGAKTDPQPVITEAEAAVLLGISIHTLRRHRREGNPLCAYIRPTVRRFAYRLADIEAALLEQRVPSGAEQIATDETEAALPRI